MAVCLHISLLVKFLDCNAWFATCFPTFHYNFLHFGNGWFGWLGFRNFVHWHQCFVRNFLQIGRLLLLPWAGPLSCWWWTQNMLQILKCKYLRNIMQHIQLYELTFWFWFLSFLAQSSFSSMVHWNTFIKFTSNNIFLQNHFHVFLCVYFGIHGKLYAGVPRNLNTTNGKHLGLILLWQLSYPDRYSKTKWWRGQGAVKNKEIQWEVAEIKWLKYVHNY